MMRKSLFYGLIITTAFLFWNANLIAEIVELCNGASTSVMDGEYNVMNNVWGASTAQCLEVDLEGTYWKVSLSEHNNPGGSVASYPAIFKGDHWGWSTIKNNPFPKKIIDIESAPFTWIICTEDIPGTWNASFEAWFDSTGTGYQYNGELMIWINYGGGAGPGGSFVGTANIDGHTWYVYYAAWSWNYIAYKIKNVVDTVNLDLRDFVHDAVKRGYLDPEWYMRNMEAGFEIWRQGQGLTTYHYEADILEGEYTHLEMNDRLQPTFHLEQNFPNPFNPETTIHYQLGKPGHVRLDIYDTLGRKINTLVNQTMSQGSYCAYWFGLDELGARIPSGVYIYTITIKSSDQKFSEVKKMLIIN